MEMFKLWISQKVRFLAYFGAFVAGFFALLAPWYVSLIIVVVAFVLDFVSFSVVAKSFLDSDE